MDSKEAANRVAGRFLKNTNSQTFDPAWILALVEVIVYVIKNCQQKSSLVKFRAIVRLAASPIWSLLGPGRRVRADLRAAVVTRLPQANDRELVRAMLETAVEASDQEILDLIKSVDQINYNP